MCNVPEGTVTAEAAGSSPSRKSLTINSFHEKAGMSQVCFSVFSLFLLVRMFFSLPPCEFLPLSQAAPVATLICRVIGKLRTGIRLISEGG